MKLGVHLVYFDLPGGPAAIAPTLARVGQAAERAGLTNLSAMDHYLQIGGMGTPGGATSYPQHVRTDNDAHILS